MKLCYCAGGNAAYVEAAVGLGWHTGARSGHTVYAAHRPLYLLDIHWVDYDWLRHLAKAKAERPALTAVPDILRKSDLAGVLAMAEEVAPFTNAVLIIPKTMCIWKIPKTIGGTPVVLGYSVPTRYGGTYVPVKHFGGRPVHLLGGTPIGQLALAKQFPNLVSADGNMAQKMAHWGVAFNARLHGVKDWEAHDGHPGVPLRALVHSLQNIAAAWVAAGYTIEPRLP